MSEESPTSIQQPDKGPQGPDDPQTHEPAAAGAHKKGQKMNDHETHDHETHDHESGHESGHGNGKDVAAESDATSFEGGHVPEAEAGAAGPEGAVPFSEGEQAVLEPEPAPDWAPERAARADAVAIGESGEASRVIVRAWPQEDGAQDRGTVRVRGVERSDVAAHSPQDARHPGRVTIEAAPAAVVVTVDGDIDVEVPLGITLQVEALPGSLEIEQVHGEIAIDAVHGSLSLSQTGAVNVAQTGAHLSAKGVHGSLHAGAIGAHASVSEIHGSLHFDRVGGHAKLREVHGDVDIARVGGHAKVREIHGHLNIERVGGHLKASQVHGAMAVTAGGNAKLMLVGGQACRVKAGGNLKCHIAEGGGNDVSLKAGAGVRVSALDTEIELKGGRHSWQGAAGEGGPEVVLTAGGLARLEMGGAARSFDGDERSHGRGRRAWRFETREGGDAWRDIEVDFEQAASSAAEGAARMAGQFEQLAEQIARRVADAVSGIEKNLSDVDMGEHDVERLRNRMSQVGERFAERLEHRLQRAVAHAARRGVRARVRTQRRGGADSGEAWEGVSKWVEEMTGPAWRRGPEGGEPTAAKAVPGASGDEVMTILRMVEEKRISAEEAEKLIAALRR
jgi:hypothetical protein